MCSNLWMHYHMYTDHVPQLAREADVRGHAADPGIGLTGTGGQSSLSVYQYLVKLFL